MSTKRNRSTHKTSRDNKESFQSKTRNKNQKCKKFDPRERGDAKRRRKEDVIPSNFDDIQKKTRLGDGPRVQPESSQNTLVPRW